MYLHTKNEVPMWSGSKVKVWIDRHTDGQTDGQTDTTENITYPHSRVVKMSRKGFYSLPWYALSLQQEKCWRNTKTKTLLRWQEVMQDNFSNYLQTILFWNQ